jgi:hypothetical protein
MPNFDWEARAERVARTPEETLAALLERFPEWARGSEQWRELVGSPNPNTLFALMRSPPKSEVQACPRVFVSHKREDADLARCLAWICNRQHFEVWLDVLDPNLNAVGKSQLAREQKALLTAGIIEMGLLNCSHVLAVITPKARDSRWVPYEYGRVKDDVAVTPQAGCWLDGVSRNDLPEYFLLGAILDARAELEGWLQYEQWAWEVSRRPTAAAYPPFESVFIEKSRSCHPEQLPKPKKTVGPCQTPAN